MRATLRRQIGFEQPDAQNRARLAELKAGSPGA